jgi:hypothetical protein
MTYYHVRTYTPFCGEEADVYIRATDETRLHQKANDAARENGFEWYDEEEWLERWGFNEDTDDRDETCDEYFAQCGFRVLGIISQEEYHKREIEGEWCI